MADLDIYYRALLEYCRATGKGEREIDRLREAIQHATSDDDSLEAVRTYCIIDETWVDRIYEGLEYIERAIREDRQFIRQNGEVLPIEKIKRVSPATVQHLARHSNLITKEPPEGEDMVPDKLYMVENLSDYTVYENRFLYMLLCYLRDFISVRLEKILELAKTYRATLTVKKEISFRKRHLRYELKLFDEDRNDRVSSEGRHAETLIAKIKEEQHIVIALLNTTLMREVAKVPMIKPPITKTNVLRMNNNFKRAMELYHFISAYNRDGFEIKEVRNTFAPMNEPQMRVYSELIMLNSYFAYAYGNRLTEELESNYQQWCAEERTRAEEALKTKIFELKQRVESTGKGMEEYMLALEERNRMLENDRARLAAANDRISALTKELSDRDDKIDGLEKTLDAKQAIIEEQLDELDELRLARESALAEQERAVQSAVDSQRAEHEADTERIRNELAEDKASALADADRAHGEHIAALERETDRRLTEQAREYEERLKILSDECEKTVSVRDERDFAWAQLRALRAEHGLIDPTEDFSSRESFAELEREFSAFARFFRERWSETKKQIKKDILWVMPEYKTLKEKSKKKKTD